MFVDVLVWSGVFLNVRDYMFWIFVYYVSYVIVYVGNWVEKLEELMLFGVDVNL